MLTYTHAHTKYTLMVSVCTYTRTFATTSDCEAYFFLHPIIKISDPLQMSSSDGDSTGIHV